MDTLIDVRNDLRKKKLFEVSDKIRDELKKIGIELNDMKEKPIGNILRINRIGYFLSFYRFG
jgi:cysteinyl-tRNA synthetase